MSRKAGSRSVIGVLSVALLLACSQHYSDKPVEGALQERGLQSIKGSTPDRAAAPQAAAIASPGYQTGARGEAGQRQSLGDLSVIVPEAWRSVTPSSSMRLAEFQIPGVEGSGAANLAVFRGNMGSVDDNVTRWLGQFTQQEGTPRRWELVVGDPGGISVTMVDVSGTFSGSMGRGGPQPHQRMVGAIVDGGEAYYYLKLLGPESTVAHWAGDFEGFVNSIRKH